VADFASQAVINLALMDAFPNDPVVGEEDSKDLKTPAGASLRAKVVEWTNEVLGTNFSEETV
jgi:3'(2'), 5'-bisphosphate nucleotidase